MGKRKKASKPMGPKKREGLASTFQCLFCNHENSVVVKMEKKIGLGQLTCKICGQNYQTEINHLSAPIDVYSDWVDACDAVAKNPGSDAVGQTSANTYREVDASARAPPISAAKLSNRQIDDLDGFIEDDEPDGEAEFRDED